MSMPRRAMKNMGLQACCLRCDEPDDAGSDRCKTCIGHHESIREKMIEIKLSYKQIKEDLRLMFNEMNEQYKALPSKIMSL